MTSTTFTHSQMDYREVLDRMIEPGCRWLDVGCGCTILPEWVQGSIAFQRDLISRCEHAHGCDPVDDRPHKAGLKKYVGDCSLLPYSSAFFDVVTANMVAEHVENPMLFACEVHRVLAPGGKFIFHTPNYWNPAVLTASLLPNRLVRRVASYLDGRPHEDIFPTYYRMNTRGAIESLPGFEIVEMRCIPTQPIFARAPILRNLESLMIRNATSAIFKELQPVWIVVLQKRVRASFKTEMMNKFEDLVAC
jgi:SAM-dependent methyltransferase